ncbi:hypothetical protein LLEC1_07545 [Akanthomyces lecanii]|uniref:Helicase-associated domain-containing protein n=1 Tax=Cordyceps confragosa TaxID=2714763 RepID=A0A179IMG0_CORDF|nr:hypothetical protein LLEC1_07545 [Akanthomyces lecanii]
MNDLRTQCTSQASAIQRMSQAGRTQDGVCFRLYTKAGYEGMPPSTHPSILIEPLSRTLLQLVCAGCRRFVDFEWMECPPPESMSRAAQDLYDWGLLKENDGVGYLGRCAGTMPFEPIWYRALLEGQRFDCLAEMVTLVILCTDAGSIFNSQPESLTMSNHVSQAGRAYRSDHLALLVAWDAYMSARERLGGGTVFHLRQWCEDRFMDFDVLERMVRSRQQLLLQMTVDKHFLNLDTADARPARARFGKVLRALATAFCTRLAIAQRGPGIYMTVHAGVQAIIEPSSAAVGDDCEWIVYNNLQRAGGRVQVEVVSPVNAEWLVDMPYFAADRMPSSGDGKSVHPSVEESLDRARARLSAVNEQ